MVYLYSPRYGVHKAYNCQSDRWDWLLAFGMRAVRLFSTPITKKAL